MTGDSMSLENRIKAEIFSYDGKMSVYLDDLQGHIVGIGENDAFETASCVKTYILGCLYDMCARGERSLSDELVCEQRHQICGSGVLCSLRERPHLSVYNTAVLMIIVSDNVATNMMIEYLGLDNINAWIAREGFLATTLHNPIDFDRYSRLGTTTPADYGRFFARLAKKQLVSPEADAAMLEIFKQQHYNSTLVGGFPQYYLDSEDTGDEQLVWCASKSGSMNACRNDGGIIGTPLGEYVIVIMTTGFSDTLYYPAHPSTVFGQRVSRLAFERFTALGHF